MTTEPIYKTTYTVEVFSRGPFDQGGDNDPFDLAEINYAICEGDCIGNVEQTHEMVVPAEAVEAEMLRIGNDGSFFEDDDEEDEDEPAERSSRWADEA